MLDALHAIVCYTFPYTVATYHNKAVLCCLSHLRFKISLIQVIILLPVEIADFWTCT